MSHAVPCVPVPCLAPPHAPALRYTNRQRPNIERLARRLRIPRSRREVKKPKAFSRNKAARLRLAIAESLPPADYLLSGRDHRALVSLCDRNPTPGCLWRPTSSRIMRQTLVMFRPRAYHTGNDTGMECAIVVHTKNVSTARRTLRKGCGLTAPVPNGVWPANLVFPD